MGGRRLLVRGRRGEWTLGEGGCQGVEGVFVVGFGLGFGLGRGICFELLTAGF